MWQWAIQTTGVGDVEQDVDGLAGADEHRVLPDEVRLDNIVTRQDQEAGRPRGRGTGAASDDLSPSR